jgi:DNA-binding HxlR family transcriptional regulator
MINYQEFECPVELTLAIIGGKWKVPILWHLLERPHRYGELKKEFPKVTQKMLTQQLRELESDGVIHREVFTQIPPKVEYSLTPIGESLRRTIEQLCEWGMQYKQVMNANGMNEKAN